MAVADYVHHFSLPAPNGVDLTSDNIIGGFFCLFSKRASYYFSRYTACPLRLGIFPSGALLLSCARFHIQPKTISPSAADFDSGSAEVSAP